MRKIIIFALLSIVSLADASGSRYAPKTRVYRQNHYNYRPQSTVIDDEIEYRSYDNNFGPLGEMPSSKFSYKPNSSPRQYAQPPPFQNPSWGPQPPEDDYPQELDLPDEDDVETDAPSYQPPQPAPRVNYNYRPQLGPRPSPPPSPRRYWDDQSGRERGDPSYSFGYDLQDQSRHENADLFGNVNGDFSFVDDEGTFRKISYSAGANKGFEVLHKTPNDPPQSSFPSSPKRNTIRKQPPVLISEPPRLPPIRIPNPGPSRLPPRSPPPIDINSGAGIGISIPVPNSEGHRNSPGSRDRVKHGNNNNRHNNPSSHGSHSNHNPHNSHNNGERDPPANIPENIPPPTGPPGPQNPEGAENADEGPKSWGALGGHHSNPGRPRQMRKRKPSLVVKVKRPAGTNPNQAPAWMYYRPPNPGRPQPGAPWVGKKPPSPTPAPYPEDIDDPSQYDENDIDPYPKDKSYSFGYNTGDQTRQEVSDAFGNIRGSYSYVDPQGIHRTVHYTAGHSGFKVLNAQPSFLRPVYTEAPSVQSIPIPIPVMSQYSHYQLPQASTIVYHIHPDGNVGSEWKPWEPTRTVSKPTIYQRNSRHRKPRMRSSSSSPRAQNNLFRLTHENQQFFPTFSNILEPEPLATDVAANDDAESIGIVEENPIFFKHIQQQQHRRSHKLKKLQKEYQSQPVFQYARARTLAPRYSVNRIGYNSEATDETAAEDQQFSDYETTPRPPRRHHGRGSKERLKKVEESSKNSTDAKYEESTISPATEPPAPSPITIDGETEIRTYQGGYGDKNPLLVISETSVSSSSSGNSNKARTQRKASGEKRASVESSAIPDSQAAESVVMASIVKPGSSEGSKEKKYVSPAALLSAKMASPPAPKAPSISAISLPLSMSSDASIPFDMNVAMMASSAEEA